MERPEALTLSLILILNSCAQQGLPTAATAPAPTTPTPAAEVASQATKVNPTALPGVFFLPPVAPNPGSLGPLEDKARVNLELFKLDGDKVQGTAVGPAYSVKAGTITKTDGHYQTNWKTSNSKLPDGTPVRIELRLDSATAGQPVCNSGANLDAGCLAFIDAKLWRTQSEANKAGSTFLNLVNGQTLPIKFHINAGAINVAPKVQILSPASGLALKEGTPLKLTGSATDFEDGDLTSALEWSVEGLGVVGKGGTLEKALAVGSYTVTAQVKDQSGALGKAQVQVQVKAPVASMTLTKLQPDRGPLAGGTEVTLTGTGFTGVTGVQFGTQPAQSFKVVSDTEIQAVAPKGEALAAVNVTVQKADETTPGQAFTYGESYEIISRGTDDRMVTLLNGKVVSDVEYSWGNPVPQASVYAKDGDKLELVLYNRWAPHCGIGQITAKTPSGVVKEIHPGFSNPNCSDRLGEVYRYEYVLPDGPGKELPIQAPDITAFKSTPGVAGTPSTLEWSAVNPTNAKLLCTLDFGDGKTQTLDVCQLDGSVQHTYDQPGTYQVKLKVADGPYASGVPGDATSGNSNSIQKFAQVVVAAAPPTVKVALTEVAPTLGSTNGGNEIVLKGTGFTYTSDVKFGDVSARSFTVVDDTKIVAIAPTAPAPGDVQVKVLSQGTLSNTLAYTYRRSYQLSAQARPLNVSIYQYFDDRLIVKLNDQVLADMAGENLPPGNYPPRILKDFEANTGDKLTFIVVNGWPWACGSGPLTLISPDGRSRVAYQGFTDANCNDRIGEVMRYEYTLPDGPGREVPLVAPDIDSMALAPGVAGTPTTLSWKLLNPGNATLNCLVDFGDGQSQKVEPCNLSDAIQHTYAAAGTYRVKLKVADGPYASGDPYDSRSGQSNGIQNFAEVSIGSPPVVNQPPVLDAVAVSPNPAQVGQEVSLSWKTSDAESDAVSCTVDFGDGQTKALENCTGPQSLTYTYSTVGTYTLTLTGTDAKSGRATKTITADVKDTPVNTAPTINNFNVTPTILRQGQLATLQWSVSDFENDAMSCAVDFGDGQSQAIPSCTGIQTLSHQYNSVGSYKMKVTVSDSNSGNTEVIKMLVIQPTTSSGAPAVNTLIASPSSPTIGQTVNLTWDVVGAGTASCQVDFGDGQSQYLQQCNGSQKLTHVYKDFQTYQFRVTAINGEGLSSASALKVPVLVKSAAALYEMHFDNESVAATWQRIVAAPELIDEKISIDTANATAWRDETGSFTMILGEVPSARSQYGRTLILASELNNTPSFIYRIRYDSLRDELTIFDLRDKEGGVVEFASTFENSDPENLTALQQSSIHALTHDLSKSSKLLALEEIYNNQGVNSSSQLTNKLSSLSNMKARHNTPNLKMAALSLATPSQPTCRDCSILTREANRIGKDLESSREIFYAGVVVSVVALVLAFPGGVYTPLALTNFYLASASVGLALLGGPGVAAAWLLHENALRKAADCAEEVHGAWWRYEGGNIAEGGLWFSGQSIAYSLPYRTIIGTNKGTIADTLWYFSDKAVEIFEATSGTMAKRETLAVDGDFLSVAWNKADPSMVVCPLIP